MDYFFPLLFLSPDFDGDAIDVPPFQLVKRKWETSTFDLATLATKHKLHLPYQAMDVFLSRCNLEVRVFGQESLNEATEAFEALRLALYSQGTTPFLCPFVTTHSINDYSGINSRDSELLREKLHPGMKNGITSNSGTVEAWPYELSFECVVIGSLKVSTAGFEAAVGACELWRKLAVGSLKSVADAAKAAPQLVSLDQSLLHIWSALESLFPEVSAELAFKVALYLAQLASDKENRIVYFDRVRNSYKLRCGVTHGSKQGISRGQWLETWSLLMDAYKSIVRRGKMPSERELLAELLG
jgi:hypothetical protein